MPFNPFNKEIGEPLAIDDLSELITRKVAEGLYVEYKSTFPSKEKIAQSIASFANSYGGWYIVGIEAEKVNNTPTKICGIALADYPDPISKVRDVIKAHVSPVPDIRPQVVQLDPNRVVLVVRIPARQDKPFISSNGRIYRRNADSSDPVFETDRYIIDRLYAEGREFAEDFEAFCSADNYAADMHRGWLQLFLAPYPEVTVTADVFLTEYAEKLLERSRLNRPIPLFGVDGITGNAPLVSSQPTHESVILRAADPAQLSSVSPSLEFFTDGRAKILIPLPFLPITIWEETEQIKSTAARDVLQSIYSETDDQFLSVRLIDVGTTVGSIGTLLSFYLEWLGDKSQITEFRTVVKIDGLQRTVPFFDSDEWGAHVKKVGLPMINRDHIRIPTRVKQAFFFRTDAPAPLLQMLCFVIGNALGLPSELQGAAFFQTYGLTAAETSGDQ
jgi:hypothetical protein